MTAPIQKANCTTPWGLPIPSPRHKLLIISLSHHRPQSGKACLIFCFLRSPDGLWEQMAPRNRRRINKQALILWLSCAKSFPMDASCQAVSSDTLVTVALCFLRRSREEAGASSHSNPAATTTGTHPTPSGDPATVATPHAFTYKPRSLG